MSPTMFAERPTLTYSPDRAGKDATIARLKAELAERPTHQDVLDASLTAYRQGYQKGRADVCAMMGR